MYTFALKFDCDVRFDLKLCPLDDAKFDLDVCALENDLDERCCGLEFDDDDDLDVYPFFLAMRFPWIKRDGSE